MHSNNNASLFYSAPYLMPVKKKKHLDSFLQKDNKALTMASSSSASMVDIDHLALSPFLSVLLDDLISSISKEVDLLGGVDKELNKLPSTVSSIQAVLQDAETKQLSNTAIADWILKLKDAAYDAVDALDEWTTLAMQLESLTQASSSSPLSCFSSEHVKFPHKIIRKKIRKINQRFEAIASQISKFDLRQRVVETRSQEIYHSTDSPWDSMTGCIITESEIIGREEDTSYIVRWLLNNINSQEDLSVCSILGMGGLGKTTVAQSVYNDNKVIEHFDVKSWVSVSNQFDLTKLTRAVLDSIPGASCNIEQIDPLQRRLQENLTGKRFLIVLDDVWNENQEEWDRFKFSLRCGAKGSSVIVTTRLETVASVTSTCPPYCLKSLSEEDCWALFKRHAFGTGNEERQALVDVGKEIVKKGGGMPLAAKVLGSLMRFKSEESEWLFIRDSQIWDLLQSNENTIMPALRLSYTHLPPHMRQCFAYCSLFPQDLRMTKEEVVNLWMANGLIHPREGMEMEDIGNDIFNSLVWRSLFQVQEIDEEGNPDSFVMHDLVHDLSCFVAKNECNICWSGQMQNVSSGTRHLLVGHITPKSSSTPKLRTLIIFKDDKKDLNISAFKCLRVLSMQRGLGGSIPRVILESIGNLKHLRYLDLMNNNFKDLPKAICGLRNLQTLNLEECYNLQVLPTCLSNLRSLRHLNIRGCSSLSEMPKDMWKMTCLQTLSMFIVGANRGEDIKELERMDCLRGALDIRCLENVKSGRDAEYANLMKKKRIKTLRLAWSRCRRIGEEKEKEVIEGLQPDSNLRMLEISRYEGIGFPRWLDSSTLPNLVEISLYGCTRCELPPSLSRLPFLKILEVRQMPSVKFLLHSEDEDINCDEMVNRFSSLEKLDLVEMEGLEELCSFRGKGGGGGGEGQMFLPPHLKKLHIYKCPNLKMLMLSPSLENLVMSDCNEKMLGLLKNLPCLSSLDIGYFEKVTCFPEGSLQNLTALRYLTIRDFSQLKILPMELGDLCKLTRLLIMNCYELVSLPEEIRNLFSIKTLDIWNCNKLESVPEAGRSSLTKLNISDCKRMKNIKEVLNGCQTVLRDLKIRHCPNMEWKSIEFVHLTSLQELQLKEFSKMTSLSDGIQKLSSTLQVLFLEDSDSMISLPEWVGSLTQLRSLRITGCEKLRMLPEGLRHLTNLERLVINHCHPDLHKRCQSRKGEDWHKISHIPHIHIVMSRQVPASPFGMPNCFG